MFGMKAAVFMRNNAIALVALFVALSGVAYAGSLAANNSVDSNAIVNEQVKSKDVKDASLKDQDLGRVIAGSFNLGSVPAHTCVSATNDAFQGADDQDMILVTPTGTGIPETNFDTGGELVMFGIPHGGEGHVKVCNMSAGAIDPGTVTYRAVLIEG